MSKWFWIIPLAIVSLLVVLVVGTFIFLRTPAGEAFVDARARPIIEQVVADQLGSEISYGRLEGRLPGELIVRDIELRDEDGDWATVDRIHLKWKPLAAIRKNIVVDLFAVENPTLFRMPPSVEREEKEETSNEGGSLPSIEVKDLSIRTLVLMPDVLGERYDIDFAANGTYKDDKGNLSARLDTLGKTDVVEADIELTSRRLKADVNVTGTETGVLAKLLDLGGALDLSIAGNGPLQEWSGDLDGKFGLYGSANGAFSGDLQNFSNANAVLQAAPGPKVPEDISTLLGDNVRLQIAGERGDENQSVRIEKISGAFGDLTATLSQQLRDQKELSVELEGTLNGDALAPFGADMVAGPIKLTALTTTDAQNDDIRPLTATFTSSLGRVRVTEGKVSPTPTFAGHVQVLPEKGWVQDERIAALLEQTPRIDADIAYTDAKLLTLTNLDVDLGLKSQSRLKASGSARIDLDAETIKANVNTKIDPALANLLGGTDVVKSALTLRSEVNGTFTDFSAKLTGTTPAIAMSDGQISPASLSATVNRLPQSPQVKATVKAKDQSYNLVIDGGYTEDAIKLTTLTLEASGASLQTSGNYDLKSGAVQLSGSLDAKNGARLPDGRLVSGTATLSAERAPNSENLTAKIETPGLRMGPQRIGTTTLAVSGPVDELEVNFGTENILSGNTYIAAARANAVIREVPQGRTITINRLTAFLNAELEEQEIKLAAPTTLTLGEAISLDQTNIEWLGDGKIALSGTYAPTYWAANVEAGEVTLPGVGLPASLTLDLDTRRAEHAVFSLSGKQSDEDGEILGTIEANGRWADGKVVLDAVLSEAKGDRLANLDLTAPMVLRRAEGGTVQLTFPDEEISGTLNIDGQASSLVALAPQVPVDAGGKLNGDITISGTLNAPTIDGDLKWLEGRFEDEVVGFALTGIETSVSFGATPDGFRGKVTGSARDALGADGAINFDGFVTRGQPDMEDGVDVAIKLNDAQLIKSPDLSVQTDANLKLAGGFDDLLLSGAINIKEIDAVIPSSSGGGSSSAKSYTPVNVVAIDQPQRRTKKQETDQSVPIKLDVQIEGNNRIFIRGRGITSEWSTSLDIGGTVNAPTIDGDVSVRDGTYSFAGRQFDITKGDITFVPSETTDPRIDLSAEFDSGEIVAVMSVTGKASDPEIELSSTPARAQEDVLAILLFGKQPTELSAVESLQFANAVAQLSGASPLGGGSGGGFSNTLRSNLGLDALSFGLDPTTGIGAVEVGKYVSDEVYVSARQSPGEAGTEVSVTYEMTDHVTIESTLQPNGAQNVSANYKRDY